MTKQALSASFFVVLFSINLWGSPTNNDIEIFVDNDQHNAFISVISRGEANKEIKNIDINVEKIAKKSIGEHGTGGMKTKIDAAKVCQLSGCSMAIANGTYLRPIKKILENNECTWFLPKISKLDARKKWIISSISPKGELVIDDGAINALKKGNSLLAAGIKKVNGKFNKGDHVKILDKNMKEFARGLSSFTSDEISKIQGQHSNKIKELLGYVSKSEVIHKDDMAEV